MCPIILDWICGPNAPILPAIIVNLHFDVLIYDRILGGFAKTDKYNKKKHHAMIEKL
jgi:hypothetical protein